MLETLRRFYNLPPQASVIYNGRSPRLFNPHMTKAQSVLAAGRLWDCAKQVSLLTERDMPVPVCIVGARKHPEEGGEAGFVARANLEFKPPLPDKQMRLLYARSGIYAGTSRYEPFGLAPLEAALSRCALVLNDIPSFRELWGDAAVYFGPNDAADLADKLQQLGSDLGRRRAWALRAYRRALDRFTAERMLKEYLQLYDSLVPAEVMAA
jgi:glycosyltransferase involved in cell wall biosynthesis